MTLALLLAPARAGAWTIATGFTEPCHETITAAAFRVVGFGLDLSALPVPGGEAWRKVYAWMEREFEPGAVDDQQKFFFFSLLTGNRSNDTGGISALNLQSLRAIHTSPEGQPDHCLRSVDRDGTPGDLSAHQDCIDYILDQLTTGRLLLLRPVDEQIITVQFTADYYGNFEVEVWAPAYYVGKALHAIQDSFTHTIRSDDLRRIRHLMNFTEAITGELDEPRDGMAHSNHLDQCRDPDTIPTVTAAIEATADLLRAIEAELAGVDEGEVGLVLTKWLTYEPGCSFDNGYCDSTWVPTARKDQTAPYLEAALGCEPAAGPRAAPGGLALVAAGLLLLAARRRSA